LVNSTISGHDKPGLEAMKENFGFIFNLHLAVMMARHVQILKSHLSGKRRTKSLQNKRAGLKSTHDAIFKGACGQSSAKLQKTRQYRKIPGKIHSIQREAHLIHK